MRFSMIWSSFCNWCSFEMCIIISNPSSAVTLIACHVANTPNLPFDSFTVVNCSHIHFAVTAPLMWIISESPIASSIRVRARTSPSLHLSKALVSSFVGFLLLASSGGTVVLAIYFSKLRSHNMASILHFYGIQLLAFNSSIR